MVCTTSQRTAGHKDSCGLVGGVMISGTSRGIKSKLGSQTLRFVRGIVRKEGVVIDKEEPDNLGHNPSCVTLGMTYDAD